LITDRTTAERLVKSASADARQERESVFAGGSGAAWK